MASSGWLGFVTAPCGGRCAVVYEEEPIRPDSPMLTLERNRVILTPHVAGLTDRSVQRMAEMVCNGVIAVLDGECPTNVVNPQVWES